MGLRSVGIGRAVGPVGGPEDASDAGGMDAVDTADGAAADGGCSGDGCSTDADAGCPGGDAWCRAKLIGGAHDDEATGVFKSYGDAIFVAGHTKGTIAGKSTQNGSRDGFVTKYDAAGNREWTTLVGTPAADRILGVAGYGGATGMWIVGTTNGDFAGTNAGGSDVFFAYVGSSGGVSNKVQFGSPKRDVGVAISMALSGNAPTEYYIVGHTRGDLGSGSNAGGRDAFVAKFTMGANGPEQKWINMDGTPRDETATDVQALKVTGLSPSEWRAIYIGRTAGDLNGTSNPSTGTASAFTVEYALDGTRERTRLFGTSNYDSHEAIDMGYYNSGIVYYVAGDTGGALGGTGTHQGGTDIFIRKYDRSWNPIWTRQFGSAADDAARAIDRAVRPVGFHAVGSAGGPVFSASHDGGSDLVRAGYGTSGSRQIGDVLGSPADERALDILDGKWAVGWTEGDVPGQTNAGGRDAFLVQLK